ncbi:MAG: exosome complex protein Rrp42 [Candidatus Micrarchaeaceae archaeon]
MNINTKDYILELLEKGMREDKRKIDEYRKIEIRSGIIENAEGSADVTLGDTRVLTGIKIDVGEPMPDKPDEGNLVTSAELLPLASTDYDVGPPSPEAIELARVVDRGIRSAEVIDFPSLFIEEGKVWNVFLDIYVLNYDGNLFDASYLASMTALAKCKLPKYEDGKVIREDMKKLKANNIVTSCTFAKIGNTLLLDPSGDEEYVMSGRITVANDEKKIRAIQKGHGGSFLVSEIEYALEKSFEKSKDLRNILNKNISE